MATVHMFGPDGSISEITVGETTSKQTQASAYLAIKEETVTVTPTKIDTLLKKEASINEYYKFTGTDAVIAYLSPEIAEGEQGWYWAKRTSGGGFTYYVSSWTACRIYPITYRDADTGVSIVAGDNNCLFKTATAYTIGRPEFFSEEYAYNLAPSSWWSSLVKSLIDGDGSKWDGGGGAGGQSSSTGGGGGKQNYTSNEIPDASFSSNPNDSNFVYGVESTDVIALYAPTRAQMRQFTDYLWADGYLEALKKNIADPLQLLISFNLFPFDIPTSGQAVVSMGKKILHQDFKLNDIASQYLTVNCGDLKVNEFWGNALDYSPYTKIDIYLPYIGFQSLSPDDVMNSTINLKYNIDLLSCSCVATIYVKRNSDNVNLNAPLYSFSGVIGSKAPLTAQDMSEVWNSVSRSAISVTQSAITTQQAVNREKSPISMGQGAANMASGVASAAMDMITSKISYPRSGSLAMNTGVLANQTPFIIINRPQQSLPDGYQTINGYPCNVHVNLGQVSGFTIIDNIHLDGFSATQEELEELKNLLKAGVIL